MGTSTIPRDARDDTRDELIAVLRTILFELRAIRGEQRALAILFDKFAAAYLNARFPHGKPTDQWGRR